jgi:CspA family cold shock protein
MKHSGIRGSAEGTIEMATGTVKFFNESKGYGFIAPDGGGNDAFVHISALENSGMHTLRENQRVSYELQQDNRGKMAAANLKAAEDSTQPEASAEEPASDQGE